MTILQTLVPLLAFAVAFAQDSYTKINNTTHSTSHFIEKMKPLIQSTARIESNIEHPEFGGLFDLAQSGYQDPIIVNTADGVGTKLLLAQTAGKNDTIGIDLVAQCVNNLLVHGAEPVFFLDCMATGKLEGDEGIEIIKGIVAGCKQANCTLAGGKTTEISELYTNKEYDLGGFSVGLVERSQLLPKKDSIEVGDAIIGLSSSGIHTAGFSLIQKIIEENQFDINAIPPFISHHKTFAHALLEPTLMYTDAVLPLCKSNMIKAVAHIGNGSFYKNIPPVLPDHLNALIDINNWHVPHVFRWLKHIAHISTDEMLHTFNCGIGMILVCTQRNAEIITNDLATKGIAAQVIGYITKKTKSESVTIKGDIPAHGMKIMVIGSGAREHALAWKLAQSPYVGIVAVAPGNGGTAQEEKVKNIQINLQHSNALLTYAQQNKIDLIVVGPEAPLADGIVDQCQKKGLRCFGPSKEAAQIEASKVFAKEFMKRHKIATPSAQIFSSESAMEYVKKYIKDQNLPIVIKADGLTNGKGVIIAHTHEEGVAAAMNMLSGKLLGDAGKKILVEQFIRGQELSFIIMTDGETVVPFATAQDYKKRDNSDRGPNTEGMGAYSPASNITPALHTKIMETIIKPTIEGLKDENKPFVGFLYVGLLLDEKGELYVLEYNCRLGDPETQPILMRLKTDLAVLCNAAIDKQLDRVAIEWDQRPALGVVLATGGYPETPQMGDVIVGIPEKNPENTKTFHAGTTYRDGKLITNGGRVACATALGDTIEKARDNAYAALRTIYWPNMFYRNDIGYRAITR